MKFRKTNGDPLRANKLSNTGFVFYVYWLNENDEQYVQVTEIAGGRGTGTGTFSGDLYKVVDLGSYSRPKGYDPSTGESRLSSDNNMSGFLRAIRRDIEKRLIQARARN
jgi:hypothetical protein